MLDLGRDRGAQVEFAQIPDPHKLDGLDTAVDWLRQKCPAGLLCEKGDVDEMTIAIRRDRIVDEKRPNRPTRKPGLLGDLSYQRVSEALAGFNPSSGEQKIPCRRASLTNKNKRVGNHDDRRNPHSGPVRRPCCQSPPPLWPYRQGGRRRSARPVPRVE